MTPPLTARLTTSPMSGLRSRPGRLAGPLVLLVIAVALPQLSLDIPGVLPGPTYTPGTLHLFAYAMLVASVAVSYHLLFGLAGMLSFGHAMFFAAGAYGLAIVLDRAAEPDGSTGPVFTIAILATLAGAAALATAVGAVSLRVSGISFAMVTLAFAQAANVVIRRSTDISGGEEGLPLSKGVPDVLVGVLNTRNLYWMALGILAVTCLAAVWIETSRAGRVAAAVRENDQRVRVLGLNPYPVRLLVFVAASTLAALAGIGFVLLQSGANPRVASSDFTLTLLVIVVLGGAGYRWGAVLGAIVYTLLDQRLSALSESDLVADLPAVLRVPLSEPLFLLGSLFVLIVLFFPGGIIGTIRRATGKVAS